MVRPSAEAPGYFQGTKRDLHHLSARVSMAKTGVYSASDENLGEALDAHGAACLRFDLDYRST
jgi:hypothetical protein